MFKKLLFFVAIMGMGLSSFAQDAYLKAKSEDVEKTYLGGEAYTVKTFPQKFKAKKPKNIIVMIGDGMGLAHVFAGLTANHGHLFLENCKTIGFSKTQSANNYVTDSAAGGTALATGVKTNNGAIGVDANNQPVKSILEDAEEKGLSSGLVATSAITHATPASFIAHQASRGSYEDIASDFLKTDIDVFIGGGYDHFAKRKDGKNLIEDLEKKGYTVKQDVESIKGVKTGKLAGFTAPMHNGRVAERKDMLPVATETAINILSNNKKGFFLMVEGSEIDHGAHSGNTVHTIEEVLDFDQAIGKALEFASSNGKTLIIVTADHETGGMTLLDGSMETGMVKAAYATGGHSAVMVPVFAYGPGAENFIGIMENTDLHDKIKELLLSK